MSWDGYIHNMMQEKKLANAAIYGLQGGCWAIHSRQLEATDAEVAVLVNAFKDNGAKLAINGLFVAGTRYMFLRCENGEIQAKKGAAGVSIAKTNQCILVGHYNEGQQPGEARNVVGKIKDYLKESGY